MRIAESEGTADIEELKVLEEKLQMYNGELNQAIEHKHQLEKQLKSTEVGDNTIDKYAFKNNENIMLIDSKTRRITKQIEKNTMELEILQNRVEELNVTNEGGLIRSLSVALGFLGLT